MSSLCKKVFSRVPVNWFSLYDSNNSDSVVFRNAAFGEIKDHSFRKTPFQEKICYEGFEFVYILCKNVFSIALAKWFSLYGSNNSDSVIFKNTAFAEIKDHSLRMTPFQKKKFVMEVLGICLPYIKGYF